MLLKRRAVRLALKKLTDGADDSYAIAQRLREAGIKGNHHPTSCPIANYLRRETGVDVRVYEKKVTNNWASRVPIIPPSKVAAFIRLFDQGYYPELDGYLSKLESQREANQ